LTLFAALGVAMLLLGVALSRIKIYQVEDELPKSAFRMPLPPARSYVRQFATAGIDGLLALGAYYTAHIFRHGGEASPRAFYVPEEHGIVVNLDHPEAVASLANGGPTAPFFAHYCMRTTLEEFTLVMVADLGYPDAPEIAREIRERADRYSRTFAPAILRFAFAEEVPAS